MADQATYEAPPMDVSSYLSQKAGPQIPLAAAENKPPMDVSRYLEEKNGSFLDKSVEKAEGYGRDFLRGVGMYPGVKFLNKVVNPAVEEFVTQPISRALYAAQSHPEDPLHQGFLSAEDQAKKGDVTGQQIMEEGARKSGNLWELTHLSEKFPGMYSDSGYGVKLKRGGLLDPSAASLGGAGIDLAKNPLTALGLFGSHAAEEAASPLVSDAATAAKEAGSEAYAATKKAMPGFLAEEETGRKAAWTVKISENPQETIKAAKALGLKEEDIPGLLLSGDEKVKRSAHALSTDPRLGGYFYEKKMGPLNKAVSEAAAGSLEDATGMPAHDVGSRVQSGVRTRGEEIAAAHSDRYENFMEQFAHEPVHIPAREELKNTLAAMADEPGLGPARKLVTEAMNDLDRAGDINGLKKMRTNLDKMLPPTASPIEFEKLSDIKTAIDKARDTSVKAVQMRRPETRTAESMSDISSQYATSAKDLSEAIPVNSSRKQGLLGPVKKFGELEPAKVRKSTLSTFNPDQNDKFQKMFPEEFDLLRRAEQARIKSVASSSGKLDPVKLVREVFGEPRGEPRYNPEVVKQIFGPEKFDKLQALKKVVNAMPPDYTPSQTPKGMQYLTNIFSEPGKTLGSLYQYGKLKASTPNIKGLIK